MSENQKNTKIKSTLLFILIGVIAGFLIIFASTKFSNDPNLIKNDFPGFLLSIAFIILSILASIYIQIILHEGGHFFFGHISGYKFISFRVGSLTLVKKSGKYHLKSYTVPGTGGQCLMMPPEGDEHNLPYKLYNLGGVLFNFIFSLLGILCITLFSLPHFLTSFLIIFAIFGIILGLLNGIPMKISGVANDGYNIRLLNKDIISRRIFYLQLKINALQTKGIRLKEMPKEWFELPEGADMKNSLHLSMISLKSAWYMDQLRFDEAQQCLESMEPYADNLIGLYQKERNCELLFLEIIGECRPEVISELYTDEIKTYINQYNRYMFSKKRILYAYILIVDRNKVKAGMIFNEAVKMQDKHPITGDAESELDIMEYVRKKYS